MELFWCTAVLVFGLGTLVALCLRRASRIQQRRRRKQKPEKVPKSTTAVFVWRTEHVVQKRTIQQTPQILHSPCLCCGQVNAKRSCRYSYCGTCCRSRVDSICDVHGMAFGTCVRATEQAVSYCYTEFDISYSYLKRCPPQVTAIGDQLVSLNLSNNSLQNLPEDIGTLYNLIELFLQYNRLQHLPESLCVLSNLEELDVKNNVITSLPEGLGHMCSLVTLNLTNNSLTSLPKSLGALCRLEELSVHGNMLECFPDELCSLQRLKALYSGENPLTSIPMDFGCLVNLKELDLSDCHLVSLPQSIIECRQLIRVWLSGNRLVCLPSHLGKLSLLKELHLRNNRIKYFPPSIELLQLSVFTAQHNPLLTAEEAGLIQNNTIDCIVPPLLELSLRLLTRCRVHTETIPQHLLELLCQALPCAKCNTLTFTHRRTSILFKTVGVFYRLPLLFAYCSRCLS